jgi:hypothetical protein
MISPTLLLVGPSKGPISSGHGQIFLQICGQPGPQVVRQLTLKGCECKDLHINLSRLISEIHFCTLQGIVIFPSYYALTFILLLLGKTAIIFLCKNANNFNFTLHTCMYSYGRGLGTIFLFAVHPVHFWIDPFNLLGENLFPGTSSPILVHIGVQNIGRQQHLPDTLLKGRGISVCTRERAR